MWASGWVSFTRALPPKVGQFWTRANTRRDAEIFVALVALPPLRRAVLRAGDHDDPEQAARMLRRRVDIFLHGIAGAGRQQ